LNDHLVTVLLLGLDQLERGIGEHCVVAPGREQLVLLGGCLLGQVADPPHNQQGGDRLAFFEVNTV
jgi:hypothetical protein